MKTNIIMYINRQLAQKYIHLENISIQLENKEKKLIGITEAEWQIIKKTYKEDKENDTD